MLILQLAQPSRRLLPPSAHGVLEAGSAVCHEAREGQRSLLSDDTLKRRPGGALSGVHSVLR